jgi:tetratricopeptide (TPR) repeat protein
LLGTVQLNLAGVLKVGGDLARAIELFEGAVDMGRRSGRLSTVRNALLNLANTDLYLGRLGRARASIEALDEQCDDLAPFVRAQIVGQKAELCARNGELERALLLYQECAERYAALGAGSTPRRRGSRASSSAHAPPAPTWWSCGASSISPGTPSGTPPYTVRSPCSPRRG